MLTRYISPIGCNVFCFLVIRFRVPIQKSSVINTNYYQLTLIKSRVGSSSANRTCFRVLFRSFVIVCVSEYSSVCVEVYVEVRTDHYYLRMQFSACFQDHF